MAEPKELKDTVEMMNSSDWQERFKAEFFQLKIRLEKLNETIHRLNCGDLNPNDFDCPVVFLENQARGMRIYLDAMMARVTSQKIDL
jgi:hypothetical protein